MIPLKLQIKNFLSYGSEIQTIEFGNYPLICLSGKNGHGKSALLDAITWALWGQARKLSGIAKADQGLLRLGQTQMMVCLDFECAGQQYRIKREYMQTYGKPVAIVEFGMYDSAQDRFMPLTDKTIRDTQLKIDQMLHLTYDGFINSAFLRQGQANEFSKKSPKERKEVLGSILGLDQYENIRRLASERIKQTTTYKQYLITLNSKLEQDLAQQQTVEASHEAALKKLTDIAYQEKELLKNQQQIEKENTQLLQKKQELALQKFQQQQLMSEQQTLQQQLRTLVTQWRSIHKKRLANTDLTYLETQKKKLLDEIKQHQQTLQDQLMLKQELLKHKEIASTASREFYEKKAKAINEKKIAIERLCVERDHLEKTLKETQSSLAQNQTEIAKIDETIAYHQKKLPSNSSDRAHIENQFEKRKEYYQRWIAQANLINAELASITQKNKLVHDEESPSCPLCEQNLSASRKRFLKNKFEDDISFLKQRFARLSILIKKLKEILIEQHSHLEQMKKNEELSKIRTILETQAADITGTQNKYQELLSILQNTLQKEQAALAQLEIKSKEELLTDGVYQKILKTVTALEQKISSHQYNQTAYQTANKNLVHLEEQLHAYQTFQEQLVLQDQRAEHIAVLCQQLKKIKQEIQTLNQLLVTQTILEKEEKNLSEQKQILLQAQLVCAKEREAILQEKGALENQKKKLEEIKDEFSRQQQELVTCTATIDDYQAIAQATGKDGIQALLIEDAIPEIEHETNELLAKLTDNQTQLFIESLRDLKKGGTKETLDIKISDAAGIRPYELFSGGEAFRIDFALRIAISKLLARRAGTSLQTLIIDEGFGSQDEEGLSNIMDALYKIQDDFAKIIIVSHLNSMKNQFPVHFVVEKGPNGSIVQVMEQG